MRQLIRITIISVVLGMLTNLGVAWWCAAFIDIDKKVPSYPPTLDGRVGPPSGAPIRVIRGPKTEIIRINQIQVIPERELIVATQPGTGDAMEPEGAFIGIWSINDDGDVAPRWRIGGPDSRLKKPRGVALDPENKEVIVADMRLNSVLTYYFPEIF